jgi:GTP1/Obg family GTP-binding protein
MAANAADDAKKIIESVRSELGAKGKMQTTYDLILQLQAVITALQATIAKMPEANADNRKAEALKADELQASVQEVNKLLKKISGEGGTNLDAMYQSIAETSSDVGDLKEKVDRLKNLVEVIREVGEKVLDRTPQKKAPIKTWFEPGAPIQ